VNNLDTRFLKYNELANKLKPNLNADEPIFNFNLELDKYDKINNFQNFFLFLKNKDAFNKTEEIYNSLSQRTYDTLLFKKIDFLDRNEKNLLLSIFVLKSLGRIAIINKKFRDSLFVNSDECVDNVFNLFNGFFV